MLDEHLDDSTDIELLAVGQCPVPVSEPIRPFDLPRHPLIMPLKEYSVKVMMVRSNLPVGT